MAVDRGEREIGGMVCRLLRVRLGRGLVFGNGKECGCITGEGEIGMLRETR